MNKNIFLRLKIFSYSFPVLTNNLFRIFKKNNSGISILNKNTDFVIEGFPRSANTFIYSVFSTSNKALNIAHHVHHPSQIILAVKKNIPTIVLIRSPQDAITSFCARDKSLSPIHACELYLKFYKSILNFLDRALVIDFNEAISNPEKVLFKSKSFFNIDIKYQLKSEKFIEEVKDKTKKMHVQNLANNSILDKSASPLPKKDTFSINFESEKKLSIALKECNLLYEDIFDKYIK